ncbi:D-lactaldehyde dehydrogenase [Pisolithus croceorrhizus]|nr:D-lactaldehyde dehydrogenase [Pisolithus croceorrhizus]KAI6126123.1 D-lactaldehyde dehydrogenase [Pisolithus croceorrhizus]
MPAIQPPTKVLVTGANGFIAAWVVRDLLEHGYSVRGTVRSVEKGEYLKNYFANYASKFEVIVVEDITKEGAFDEAVRGVEAIAHMASPISVNKVRLEDVIEPAVKGTTGLLQSALQYGQSVKRIVYTSSAAAVRPETRESPTFTVFSEEDWNVRAIEILKEQGDKTSTATTYHASKTLAEQSAWKFVKDREHEISWDLTSLSPPLTLGPIIHDVTDASSLRTSMRWFYDNVVDPVKSAEAGNNSLVGAGNPWADVRDVAKAHRLALEKEEAGGERIIISGPWTARQTFIDAANALEPAPKLSMPLPKGNPGSSYLASYEYDATKSQRILGLEYRSVMETTRDTLLDFAARGW